MKKCFIISPIGAAGSDIRKKADATMKYIIEPACEKKGYKAIRADKISSNGIITQEIIQNLLTAELAIADLTDRNPNVFYELAIRHTMNLPTIQITRDDLSSIPFDVNSVRTIKYGLEVDEADNAKESLIEFIENIESMGTGSNPVNEIIKLLNISLPTSNNDSNNIMSDLLLKVNSIPEKLDQLENNIGIRFSQMLTAFAQSFNAGTTVVPTEEQVKQKFLESFLNNIMNDPQKGISQMKNMLDAQKFFEENGLIKRGDDNV